MLPFHVLKRSIPPVMALAAASYCTILPALERTLICSDGIRLATKQWRSSKKTTTYDEESKPPIVSSTTVELEQEGNSRRRILCLHGWLDNADTFHLLGPALGSDKCGQFEVVALDFPGHGRSSHKSKDGPTQVLFEYVFYVAEAVRQLGWDNPTERFTLIGHSMGGGVAIAYAAAFPERVDKLVLVEGFGPLARNAKDSSKHIRHSCQTRMKSNKALFSQVLGSDVLSATKKARIYPNIAKAVDVRMATAKLSPGEQYISKEAAYALVTRATNPVNGDGEAVTFCHDPRLNWPSIQYSTTEQVESLISDIECPVCCIQADNGWPIPESQIKRALSLLKPTLHKKLPGSHHLHADPDSFDEMLVCVQQFLSN
mmetsp:Transcript_61621/g.74127  ORF Transcript_61621/g.74127 Transcript_61621/m.74127 type:complete len:372 (-) Transcript_61621:285-1400(-)